MLNLIVFYYYVKLNCVLLDFNFYVIDPEFRQVSLGTKGA
jgi:hypothetical protein